MNADGTAWGMCAAYGCPLLGTVGDAGKWVCCCHFNIGGAANDAITAELHRQKPLVDRVLSLRATHAGYRAILAVESELIELTREIGRQHSIPTACVVGPTHAEPSFSEIDA
jgi:hypothetical protein